MQQEFARVSRRAPLGAVDPKKYEVEKPEGEAAEDEESWKSVSATTQINLEYARIKSVNQCRGPCPILPPHLPSRMGFRLVV